MNQTVLFITSVLILTLFLYIFIDPNAKFLGRKIWYDPKRLISCERDGKDTSQQVFDIYSFSHITHGILLYFILHVRAFNFSNETIIYTAVTLEVLWEFIENTPYIINKYRKNKAYKNYPGDTVANIIGDTICAVLGVYIAMQYPLIAILYVVISELVLYRWRANLLYLSITSLYI